jgi:hypothetical protein
MVLTTIGAIIGTLVLLQVTATLVRPFDTNALFTLLAQHTVAATVAGILLFLSVIGLYTAAIVIALPIIVRTFAYVWFYYYRKRLLAGKYGTEAMWAAELVDENDEAFIEASKNFSDMEIREIGIMSHSKAELRERTIEQAKENDD